MCQSECHDLTYFNRLTLSLLVNRKIMVEKGGTTAEAGRPKTPEERLQ